MYVGLTSNKCVVIGWRHQAADITLNGQPFAPTYCLASPSLQTYISPNNMLNNFFGLGNCQKGRPNLMLIFRSILHSLKRHLNSRQNATSTERNWTKCKQLNIVCNIIVTVVYEVYNSVMQACDVRAEINVPDLFLTRIYSKLVFTSP